MKKILQIKPSKRRIAAASSVATGSGGKSSRSNQKTLHPLFTCSTEQREAWTQRRLRTVLEEASSLPTCPRPKSETRPKNRNIHASLVPDLYLLAAGDVEHSFVVRGFEDYCAHDNRPKNKLTDDLRSSADDSEVAAQKTGKAEKLGSDSNRKSSPREKERGVRRERTAERCEPPKSSRNGLETPRFEKDSFAKPSVVSPATTVTTATTSDQRIPEISALKEIITNHQVPSMIACITEKSPSCTPTHSVAPPLPAELDRRVSDWVDNCVSQEIAKDVDAEVQKKSTDTYEESLLSELQRSYLKLVDSEDFSDLVVETADRPIRAHKAILFVRCLKISQSLSADSCFWHLKWCSAKAALYFLRYLYAADVSFVPGLNGQLRKDLLTLCCQYQTDELAARLIRERSPSPSQLTQKQASQNSSRTRKRSAESQTVELPLASENRLDGSSSSQKKTRMSITCETVSMTIPEDGRCSIQQSPRLPQSFPPFQQSTPFITRITDDEKRDSSARGSADHPIELGSSSSDLFTDDEVVMHPAPPLSPLHQTPKRREEVDFEPEPAQERQHEEFEVAEESPFRNSHKFMQRKSISQPIIHENFLDDNDDDGHSDNGARPQVTPRSSRLVEGLDVTPLPRYSTMKTPEMHKHLDRYGIKTGIGKQKAVKLLKHIYQATHLTQPAAAEPAASQSSSSGEDSDVPVEETMVHDDDEEVSDNVDEKITRYIKKTPALYDKILRFEPLEVSEFKKELREHGIRINDKMLVNYLDFHCVNISFGTQRKRSPKKARRRKPIRKPGPVTITSSQP